MALTFKFYSGGLSGTQATHRLSLERGPLWLMGVIGKVVYCEVKTGKCGPSPAEQKQPYAPGRAARSPSKPFMRLWATLGLGDKTGFPTSDMLSIP